MPELSNFKDFESIIEKPAELIWVGNNIKNCDIEIEFHNHGNLAELLYTGNCSGFVYDEDGKKTFEPHSIILRNKYTEHRESYRFNGKPTNIYYCNFNNFKLLGTDDLIFSKKSKCIILPLPSVTANTILRLFKQIFSEMEKKQFAYKKFSDFLLNEIIVLCFRLLIEKNLLGDITFTDPEFFPKIKEYIDNNFTSPNFSLSLLADSLYISKSYLTKIFKKNIGYPPMDYINQKRTSLAITYLLNTNDTLTEIAYKLGYSNSIQFIKLFKKRLGNTPSEFRKTHQTANKQ